MEEIKKEVNYIFEQHPELANIGTKEQYSKYLKTIFPESKVKGIFLHGTSAEFENFSSLPFNYFFTKDMRVASINSQMKGKGTPKIIRVVLNSKNPWDYAKEGKGNEVASFHFSKYSKEGYDTMINENEVAVYEPEQIYILGSKKDIQGFKEFVKHNKGTSLEWRFVPGIITVLLASLFFLSLSITGNAIGNMSTTSSNWIAVVLFVLGVAGFAFFKRR